jgi:hypothetical protein
LAAKRSNRDARVFDVCEINDTSSTIANLFDRSHLCPIGESVAMNERECCGMPSQWHNRGTLDAPCERHCFTHPRPIDSPILVCVPDENLAHIKMTGAGNRSKQSNPHPRYNSPSTHIRHHNRHSRYNVHTFASFIPVIQSSLHRRNT